MKTSLKLGVAGVLVAGAAWAGPKAKTADWKALVAPMKTSLLETRRWFHAHPELSNREVETGKEIARRLTAMGLQVQTGVAGNGVVATLKGALPGKRVAYRADIDALPVDEPPGLGFRSINNGAMHACGHDIHTAVALGVAELLSKQQSTLHGEVRFFFQPAEEGPPPGEEGGASLMIKQGVLDAAPVAVFGLHSWPGMKAGTVGVRSESLMAAADRFTLRIKGKKAHGAAPQDGVDAVYVASQVVNAAQSLVSRENDPKKPLVLTFGSFHAGNRFNILAEEAVLEGTVRTLDPGTQAKIGKDLERVVAGICSAHGATYELHYANLAPVTFNEPKLAASSITALENALGKDQVQQAAYTMLAEDFGFFGQKVPSFYFFLGTGNASLSNKGGLHTPDFLPDEDAIPTGVAAMAALITAASAP